MANINNQGVNNDKDTYIPPGQTPLGSNPYVGQHGLQNDIYNELWQSFTSQFGRNPTQQELTMLAPSYYSGDPHISNQAQGNATVAQYYQNFSQTPDKLAAQQQKQYLANAPQHYNDVNKVFQSQLGRTATQDELDHFGSLIASGNTDPYQLQTFLQQQPEYQTTANKKFQDNLSTQLSGYDQDYFKNNILPSIQEAYAKQGRSFDSSAFQNAATQSGQQQNTQRQQFLAGLSAQQYGGVQANAYQDYANQVANQNQLTNAGIQAQYQGIQNTNNRVNQINDFNTQSQLYNQYLDKYGKRGNGIQGALSGAISGATLGSKFGPWGALAGGVAGGGIGYAGSGSSGGSY